MGTQWSQKERRQIPETRVDTLRECQKICPEAIAIRQYVDRIPGAELSEWVIKEGLKFKIQEGVLCFED